MIESSEGIGSERISAKMIESTEIVLVLFGITTKRVHSYIKVRDISLIREVIFLVLLFLVT